MYMIQTIIENGDMYGLSSLLIPENFQNFAWMLGLLEEISVSQDGHMRDSLLEEQQEVCGC